MMLLRINEALFLLILFVFIGAYTPSCLKGLEERERNPEGERSGLEFSFATGALGGAIGIPLCLLFLRFTRREDTTAPPSLRDFDRK